MRKKKVSVRDIASECGVAIGTVSRVINNKPGVRSDLKEKVLHAMRKYNYNPYSNVPIVDKARARTIKVVMPYYDTASVFMNGFYARGVEGIKKAALEKGYEMTIAGEHSFSEKALVSNAGPDLNATAAGVVFFCSQRNWNEMIGLVQEREIPCALVNRETTRKGVITVREKSRQQIFADMVKHLVALGHKKIYCLTPVQGRIIHNLENFQHAIRANGLPFDESSFIENAGTWAELGRLHSENRMPDAFFCIGDMNAITLIKDLQKIGYQVPDDVAVVGYNNIDLCQYTTPEITTVDNHIDKMAGLATKLLIEKIGGSGYEEMDIEMDAELVIRESCGSRLKK